eukprot:scaffold252068_cov22-Tisochrysis_lutea.AAC.1
MFCACVLKHAVAVEHCSLPCTISTQLRLALVYVFARVAPSSKPGTSHCSASQPLSVSVLNCFPPHVLVQPLAVASMSELCVWVTMTARGSKIIRVVLPSVQLRDSRPGVQPERALALTTEHVVGAQQVGKSLCSQACCVGAGVACGGHAAGGQVIV